MSINDPSLEPPTRPDFRRVNRGVPQVLVDGKWVRYKRASSCGKILDDDSNLVDWRIRTIVEGCAQRPDLMAQVSTLDHDADKREIRDIAEDCLVAGKGTQRAVKGTAIHRMLDLVDSGADWTPAPQFQAGVQSYVDTLELYGLVPVDIECHCVDDLRRIAGTADRRYRTTRNLIAPDGVIIPIGTVILADTKTGQALEYNHGTYSTQLAAYAGSVRYDVTTNERTPFDPPTYQDWAIIMHVDADDARTDVYWVDLEAGRQGLALADSVREWRKRTDLITPARPPLYPVGAATAVPDVPTAPVEASGGAGGADAAPETLTAVRAWLRGRVAVVREAGAAPTDALLRAWPPSVAGLKYDTQTAAQLDAISEVLWDIEKQFSLAFPPTDPRTPEHAPRDFSDMWARPTGNDKPGDTQVMEFRMQLDAHPRRELLLSWVKDVILARTGHTAHDNWALAHALYEFAKLGPEWSDDDVTTMLDGTLRALGYDGMEALGIVVAEDAPRIMSAAFAITAGNAMLLYSEDGKPVVRTNIQKGK